MFIIIIIIIICVCILNLSQSRSDIHGRHYNTYINDYIRATLQHLHLY